MNNDIAIKVENLTKIYHLYDKPQDRLKEALNPFKKSYHHDFYAMRDVSFEIKKGETVGIIGKNGAGKSTLLKMITGVLTPTAGSIEVNGKIASLLELGAGFNPEMTGLENIYLNGTLMGFTHEEMDNKIDAILEFADIGEFIHQSVKMYSSGMFARLAFSVAINVEPDILIVDEVLSVGDVFFQQKCIRYMQQLQEKTTTLYVSHDLPSISALVNRIFIINNGTLTQYGNIDEGLTQYTKQVHESYGKNKKIDKISKEETIYKKTSLENFFPIKANLLSGRQDIKITYFSLRNQEGRLITTVEANQHIEIHLIVESYKELQNVFFGYIIEDRVANKICGETTLEKKLALHCEANTSYHAVYQLRWPRLQPGEYTLTLGIGEGISIANQVIQCWAHNITKINAVNSDTVHCIFNHSIDAFTFFKEG